ncbi:unnamed protein product, partial [Mesocestoides corti]|uniref:AEBP1 protein n=1 Tax=Mesocestoides corti TaxID=53468 RepID=A0A0R3UC58_MESCO
HSLEEEEKEEEDDDDADEAEEDDDEEEENDEENEEEEEEEEEENDDDDEEEEDEKVNEEEEGSSVHLVWGHEGSEFDEGTRDSDSYQVDYQPVQPHERYRPTVVHPRRVVGPPRYFPQHPQHPLQQPRRQMPMNQAYWNEHDADVGYSEEDEAEDEPMSYRGRY